MFPISHILVIILLNLLFTRGTLLITSGKEVTYLNDLCKNANIQERIIYLHFQKTAGTSVESGLKRFVHEFNSICGSNNINIIFERPTGGMYRKSLFTPRTLKADIVAGHGYWGCHNSLDTSSSYIYTAFFRDPLDRAMSHHLRSSCKEKKGCDLKRFLHLHAKNYYYNRLVYPNGLVGAGFYGEKIQRVVPYSKLEKNKLGNLLEFARKNIDKMKFVGLVEEFDASMLLFGRFLSTHFNISEEYMQINLLYCKSQNSYRNVYKTYANSAKNVLRKELSIDNELFHYAEQKFRKQVSWYGKNFVSDLNAFKEKQERFDKECCTRKERTTCVGLYSFD